MTAYRTMPMKWADNMSGMRPCALCGKEMKKDSHLIHVIDGGGAILHPEDEHLYEPDSGNMDFHEVGPECAKKLKGWAVKA